jgi:toxin ParE1/3/4
MSLPVVFRPTARREFDDAIDWYEGQRQGLGVRFAGVVESVLRAIGGSPEMHPVILKDFRRAVVPHFPYLVIYRVLADHIAVLAVIHGKRDLSSLRARE